MSLLLLLLVIDNLISINSDIEHVNVSNSFISSPEQILDYINYTPKSVKIIHLNIRSIKCNFNDFNILLSRIPLQCDIIILSECWLSKVESIPTISGYNFLQSQFKNQNDGVVIYGRSDLQLELFEPVLIDANCLICKFDNELAIIAIYRSPSIRDTGKFLDSLDNLLKSLAAYKSIALIGDININISLDNKHSSADEYLNLLASHKILPAHLIPTRGLSCLDHVMLKTDSLATTVVLDSVITDHAPVLLSINCGTKHQEVSKYKKYLDINTIKTEIEKADFTYILQSTCANEATEVFVKLISNIIKANIKTKLKPRKQRNIKPWITPGLIKCIRNRDKLHMQHRRSPDNAVLKITYIRYRNYCNKILKKVKTNYERDELAKAKNNIKATWGVIKKITNLQSSSKPPMELLHSDDPKSSIDTVNRYFANIGEELATKVLQNSTEHQSTARIPTLLTKSTELQGKSMGLLDVDTAEVDAIIKNLRKDCATGWDDIPSSVLKLCSNTLIVPITHICNISLTNGVFPKVFKKAIVHPIFKDGDRNSVNNYRPISVLTTLSKVLEKVLNKRLLSYLDHNNIIACNQYGFRKGKSTEGAVLELTECISRSLDKGLKTVGIFLDLSKAFDTVSIPILLKKLEAIGVRGNALKIFKDYLTNRTQCVKIGEYTSGEEFLNFGIPQGSVLGPTLFLVYINDLCQLTLPHCKIITYADDTVLVVNGSSWEDVCEYAESSIGTVIKWLQKNLLTINLNKTKFIPFSLAKVSQPRLDTYSIKAHYCDLINVKKCSCIQIDRAVSIKYLGVYVDQLLNWHHQIDFLKGKIRKLIYIFKTLRTVACRDTLTLVYTSLAQCLISYCIGAWGGANKTALIPLERAQRAVLKVMLRKPFRYSTSLLYNTTKVLTVRQLYVLQVITIKHTTLPFTLGQVYHKRRRNRICNVEHTRTTFARRQHYIASSTLYNKVNQRLDIFSLPLTVCKSKTKNWLLTLSYEETESLIVSTF